MQIKHMHACVAHVCVQTTKVTDTKLIYLAPHANMVMQTVATGNNNDIYIGRSGGQRSLLHGSYCLQTK